MNLLEGDLSVKHVRNSAVHFTLRDRPQTIGLVKNAVVKARAAWKFRTNHNTVLWPARTEPLRPLRPEDSHNRHTQQVRKMHRTAIVAEKKPAVRKHR